jgi:hypothetical protein
VVDVGNDGDVAKRAAHLLNLGENFRNFNILTGWLLRRIICLRCPVERRCKRHRNHLPI